MISTHCLAELAGAILLTVTGRPFTVNEVVVGSHLTITPMSTGKPRRISWSELERAYELHESGKEFNTAAIRRSGASEANPAYVFAIVRSATCAQHIGDESQVERLPGSSADAPVSDSDIGSLTRQVLTFRDARDWAQFHNPKDLAVSLCIEAAELLENFQWKSSTQAVNANEERIKDELGDVLIYALLLCHTLGLSAEHAVRDKLAKNSARYPVDKAYGSSKKYNEL